MLIKNKSRASDVFLVDKLIEKRIRGGYVEYLVKWKDWSNEHNSWEPKRNILDRGLINAFERSLRQGESVGTSQSADEFNHSIGQKRQADKDDSAVEGTENKDEVGSEQPCKLARPNTPSPPPIFEHRLRLTTVLDSAASASAAILRHKVATSSSSHYQRTHLVTSGGRSTVTNASTETPQPPTSSPSPTSSGADPTTVAAQNDSSAGEDRPKILLTIPRQRILACPPPGIPSSLSSSSSATNSRNSSTLTTDQSFDLSTSSSRASSSPISTAKKLLSPVELPRRSQDGDDLLFESRHSSLLHTDAKSPQILSSDISHSIETLHPSTSSICPPPPLPKIVLFSSDRSKVKSKHHRVDRKRKRHRHESRYNSDGGEGASTDEPFKFRRHSGSSYSSYSSTPTDSPDKLSPPALVTNDDLVTPRLAPLKIHLSRSMISKSCKLSTTTIRPNRTYRHHRFIKDSVRSKRCDDKHTVGSLLLHSPNLLTVIPPPDSKRFQLVRDMSVTDITVGGLTITIKECPEPDNFFGSPSSQLVRLSNTPPRFAEQPPINIAQKPICVSIDDQLTTDNPLPSPTQNNNEKKNDQQSPDDSPTTYADENVAPVEECGGELASSTTPLTNTPCKSEKVVHPSPPSQPSSDPPHPDDNCPTKNEPESHQQDMVVPETTNSLLMAAATEALMQSASREAPSSPGLLVNPSSPDPDDSKCPSLVATAVSRDHQQDQLSPPVLEPVLIVNRSTVTSPTTTSTTSSHSSSPVSSSKQRLPTLTPKPSVSLSNPIPIVCPTAKTSRGRYARTPTTARRGGKRAPFSSSGSSTSNRRRSNTSIPLDLPSAVIKHRSRSHHNNSLSFSSNLTSSQQQYATSVYAFSDAATCSPPPPHLHRSMLASKSTSPSILLCPPSSSSTSFLIAPPSSSSCRHPTASPTSFNLTSSNTPPPNLLLGPLPWNQSVVVPSDAALPPPTVISSTSNHLIDPSALLSIGPPPPPTCLINAFNPALAQLLPTVPAPPTSQLISGPLNFDPQLTAAALSLFPPPTGVLNPPINHQPVAGSGDEVLPIDLSAKR